MQQDPGVADPDAPDRAQQQFDAEVEATRNWMVSPRFAGLRRLYSARQVVQQRGAIGQDHTVARVAAERFGALLRRLFSERRSITTFGPYSPGQAVAMKRAGIEGIYLGGWATSAKGSLHEDPGPDLAGYPLSSVPDEAAGIVRALLAADRNQSFARSRMSATERAETPEVDYSPFIIADADTGHGGDPHVRNLIRRFVEVGVPGYHIEDQRPGQKKCGHQGGKVLVGCDEQIKRLNAARFQLDVMGVEGIIVARTDAESATLLDSGADERDQPFVLGVTRRNLPPYKAAYLAVLRRLTEAGIEGANGHLLYALPEAKYTQADAWLEASGVAAAIAAALAANPTAPGRVAEEVTDAFVEAWQAAAGLCTYADAVAEHIASRSAEGVDVGIGVGEWLHFARNSSLECARERAAELGIDVYWDAEGARTPEGYFQVQGGISYAIAKSLAVAPFADVLWMETKTAHLGDAREFAEAVHAAYPDKMLAYNLSPSFNWDTTGMSDTEMREFPRRLGELGYVFNFITYGGHQIDGMAGEEFAASLNEEGMLALAKLQRRLRLVDSPYRTPQTLVGGPRADAALMACSGRTATTRAMGKGSTQFQHLAQTEVPTGTLEEWLEQWAGHHGLRVRPRVRLRPWKAGSEILELTVASGGGQPGNGNGAGRPLANIVFAVLRDRRDRPILSVRDQNTLEPAMRRKRLMTLVHLFLMLRYEVTSVHYLTPTDDNRNQTASMRRQGLFASVADEVGEIIVADVDADVVATLTAKREALEEFIARP
ncbi:MAG: isocitrate lyase/phosphoenolpyruvate mutase family protein [bacterium]|nr:isocitrate lyase/phosphoenolpyruvate mutase family protein [bacterium]